MPAPQAAMMKELVMTQFRTFAIKVPGEGPLPRGFLKSLAEADRAAVALPSPPALFVPDSTYKGHVDTQKHLDKVFGAFIEGIVGAVCSAWDQWQKAAVLTSVIINGPVAAGGQVVGPPLTPLILASAPSATEMELKYSKTVATVIGQAFQAYTATIKVAGMPWYPAFAMVPSPVAPPAPNVPCPVAALVQVTVTVEKAYLKAQMISNLGSATAPYHAELFDAIADAFEKCFKIWQTATQVTNVLGTGPVPTFAPPAVPGGPVVGGVGNMTPGGFV